MSVLFNRRWHRRGCLLQTFRTRTILGLLVGRRSGYEPTFCTKRTKTPRASKRSRTGWGQQQQRWLPRRQKQWRLLVVFAIAFLVILLSVAADASFSRSLPPIFRKRNNFNATTTSFRGGADNNAQVGMVNSERGSIRSKRDALTVVQVVETEIWDGQKWKAPTATTSEADDSEVQTLRWTSESTNEACASPNKQQAPTGYKFEGQWKIVTSTSSSSSTASASSATKKIGKSSILPQHPAMRDPLGWEYLVQKHPAMPTRRRVWLRTVVPVERVEKEEAALAKSKPTSYRQHKMPFSSLLQAVIDDFNFKGFGLNLYKSWVFPKEFGMAFRLPLTANLDTFEQYPMLPSITTSLAVYNPAVIAFFINISMRVEAIKWLCSRLVTVLSSGALAICFTAIRILWLAFSILIFPVVLLLTSIGIGKKTSSPSGHTTSPFSLLLLEPPDILKPYCQPGRLLKELYWKCFKELPNYSRTLEERLGFSFSWRISALRGYQYRVSYWHWYAPTLTSLWYTWCQLPAWFGLSKTATETAESSSSDPTTKRKKPLSERPPMWFVRRSAQLGLSTSTPSNDPPFISGSALISLQGFYLFLANRNQQPNLSSKRATSKAQLDEETAQELQDDVADVGVAKILA